MEGILEFKEVCFNYEERTKNQVLNNISFTARKSENIAIVGPSGAGKSTITSLILHFHEVIEGKILIDGKNINDYNINYLRHNIGIVPQDTFLFGGTIQENIAYGKIEANLEEIIEASKKANAHSFIEEFEDGYNTVVGERGVQLSGGQRQRIAIARTILKDPSILILDEATSSLDSESENQVQIAINELMKNRTTIVIAHRLCTIKNADKILVLDNGRIVESGIHSELLNLENGVYNRLSKFQSFIQ